MGLQLSSYTSPQQIVSDVASFVTGKKRKHSSSDSEDEINKVIDVAMHTPKRKKLEKTAQYIFQALFREGKNSDVTVRALGEEFHLHKVYLCQSPYFASMFGGSWVETAKRYITIDIIDPQITVDSLKVVFGSLYNDEVVLNPTEIAPILATASMFQVDGIIEKCFEVMLETINPKTSLHYYNISCQYGDKKLQDACTNWFLVNLMTYYYAPPMTSLKLIPLSLMTKLAAHPGLFVMQTEFSIYVMLKFWMYMTLNPDPPEEPTFKDLNMYFCSRKGETAFLNTKDGEPFVGVFKGLRLHNLITHYMDVEMIQRDNIIPYSWLNLVVLQQWKVMLRVNQNDDKGPPMDIPEEIFLKNSLRCGRIITEKERHMWRWTGFHYGVDLLMIVDGTTLSIKRNHRAEYEQLLSLQNNRHIAIRVTIVTLNEQRQIVYSQTTDIKVFSLTKSEETVLLNFDDSLKYPLIISVNILFTNQPEELREDDFEPVKTVS